MSSLPLCSVKTKKKDLNPSLGIADNTLLWGINDTITYKFLNGTPEQQKKTISLIELWHKEISINAVQVSQAMLAEIRIEFRDGITTSWSTVGTKCRTIPSHEPTTIINGALAATSDAFQSTILHEWGHVLGLLHEHQHPRRGEYGFVNPKINWNIEQMKAGLPGWTGDDIQMFIIDQYPLEDSNKVFGNYDSKSIMLYYIPNTWAENLLTNYNTTISDGDIEMVQKLYKRRKEKNDVSTENESTCIIW